MSRFGYSPRSAEALKDRLDRDLQAVEYYLGRIACAVPQAGSVTARLTDAGETVQEVVSDLHAVIDERTEVPA